MDRKRPRPLRKCTVIIVWGLAVIATVTIPFVGWRLEPSTVATQTMQLDNGIEYPLKSKYMMRATSLSEQPRLTTKSIANESITGLNQSGQFHATITVEENQVKQHSTTSSNQPTKPVVKSFLGTPLRFVPSSSSSKMTTSTVHCVGDNFSPLHAWKYRSCQFQHLCWNNRPNQKLEFVLIPSAHQLDMERALASWNNSYAHISTQMNASATNAGRGVSLGGLSVLTARKRKFRWFPSMLQPPHDADINGFYQLENTVWIPFDVHFAGLSTSTAIMFDFIFPIYNLLAMFGWERAARRGRVLLTNFNRDCTRDTPCHDELSKYIPLLGSNAILHTLYDDQNEGGDDPSFGLSEPTSSSSSSSSKFHGLICAPRGAAGMGYLTDHGWKRHGSKSSDYRESRNVGRGILFDKFRRDALSNMGIRTQRKASFPISLTSLNKPIWRIVISIDVALNDFVPNENMKRIQGVAALLEATLLRRKLNTTNEDDDEVEILPTAVFNQSLYDQMQLIRRTCVYICVNTGDSAVAAFLPRGASLILFYDDNEKVVSDIMGKGKRKSQQRHQAVMLDWDLWNNMAHLYVHWLPLSTMKDKTGNTAGSNVLNALVNSELVRLRRQRQYSIELQSRGRQKPQGTFNSLDIVHVPQVPWSSVHCVGDTFQNDAAAYRSCLYEMICFDMDRKSFVTFPFTEELPTSSRPNLTATYISTQQIPVLIGQNARLADRDIVSWSPTELLHEREMERKGYYELPSNIVWVPFFGETPNIVNPGHLLWDYFLPIFSLASMFDLLDTDGSGNGKGVNQLFLTNLEHDDCVPERPEMCFTLISKFLPLIGAENSFSHDRNVRLNLLNAPKSNLVCGKGVAGIGMLTDHGLQRHGQGSVDYDYAVNAGRGPCLLEFRNFLLRNHQHAIEQPESPTRQPFRITVSTHSSQTPSRNRDFRKQIDQLELEIPPRIAVVQSFVMSELPLNEQIRIATKSSVYISVIGGATVTATFLPNGASLILFVNDIDQFVDDNQEKGPVYMDWDFWNNASYLRVHWMTISSMDNSVDLEVLVKVVRNDLLTMTLLEST